jgi:hypothetical protein
MKRAVANVITSERTIPITIPIIAPVSILFLGERTGAEGEGVLVWCAPSVNEMGLVVEVDRVRTAEEEEEEVIAISGNIR